MLAVLLVVIAAPIAYADTETPTFTCTGTCLSPPTAPAVTFPSPTLDITWNGLSPITTQLTPGATPADPYEWFVLVQQPGGLFFIVTIDICDLTIANGCGGNFITSDTCPGCTLSGTGLNGEGELSFAPTAAPEPSSVALMLLGVGLVFAMRKRTGQRLPQAS